MNLPDFLAQDKFGYIHVAGHRIGLRDIVCLYHDGFSTEMLADEFPTLSVGLIQEIIAFYEAHKGEVDAYVAQEGAAIDKQRAQARQGPDLAELRRRYEALRRAEAK
jgi:uncharacterized protein (DUF433 family)